MIYKAEIIIIRNVNGRTQSETLRKEFGEGSTIENRRNAIQYLQNLEDNFRLAESQGVELFQSRDEVTDFRNFNTLIKSLTCIHSNGTVELINNRFMDDYDQTETTIEALCLEFDAFLQEVINTGESVQVEIFNLPVDEEEYKVFGADLNWVFEVNDCPNFLAW